MSAGARTSEPGAWITVREECPADAGAVRRVLLDAFGGTVEADIVDALRAAGAVTLALVAVQAGETVGQITFSPVAIDTASGARAAIGLAPMSVAPTRQRAGIGSALVRAGLGILRQRGHTAVIVLGHPAYYPRFGFERASRHGIRWEHECPDEAFLALELAPGALRDSAGVARYRPEFGGR